MLYVLALVYVGSILMLVLMEHSVVYPVPEARSNAHSSRAETVEFYADDGTCLHGWFLDRPEAENTIVYFHGNGEDVAQAWPRIEYLGDCLQARILLFDYRGYGHSAGSPSEAGLVADGVAAVEWTCQRTGTQPADLVLMGRSIGGGVASQVAARHPPRALVLVSSFSSLVTVAARKYPVFPVRLLMRNRFDNVEALSGLKAPLLQIHGQLDRIVPCANGRRLYDSVDCQNRRFVVIANRGHNDLGVDDFVTDLQAFLDNL